MAAPGGPSWTRGSSAGGGPGGAYPGMRVSDAERAAATDRLAQHYGDGRLDEAEFNERVDRAMKAKTRADLGGLFDDLPGGDPAGILAPDGAGFAHAHAQAPAAPQPWRGRPFHPVRVVLLAVLVSAAVGNALVRPFFPFPWVLIAIVAFALLRGARRRGRR